jgi:chromate reductase
MNGKIKILGFGGSLREGSFNKALLYAAKEAVPENAEFEIFDKIGTFPLFDQKYENAMPPEVLEFKEKIKNADAIVISTPEYNYSVPGYLKNAIDWASRPYGNNSFEDKPVAIMSASGGMLGGARAQYHLRQIFVFLNMHPVNKPEVLVANAQEKIKDGKVTDEKTIGIIGKLMQSLVDLTIRLKK